MAQILTTTPRQDGFRMPAEFEKHAGCWMIFPERTDNWRGGARLAQKAFIEVACAIAQSEPVTMGVSGRLYPIARRLVPSHIRMVELSNDDAWIRDTGAIFVVDGRGGLRGVDFRFNAWGGLNGGLYFPWDQDDLVARKMLDMERVDRYVTDFILEGGSIDVDGEGTLLTTEECLLNPNRNPHKSKREIEEILAEYLNIQKVIWLGLGVYEDETDGHIDNFCRFVRPGVVVLTWTEDRSDPMYVRTRDAYRRLTEARDARGRALEVHLIEQPTPLVMTEEEAAGIDLIEGTHPRVAGNRLAGSYVNFYIGNSVVVVPTFDNPHDEAALQHLQNLFADRRVIAIEGGREILLGGGNVHCITQQQPAVCE